MQERIFRLKATDVMDRFEAGRFGEKQAIKKNKKSLRKQQRILEKRAAQKEFRQFQEGSEVL